MGAVHRQIVEVPVAAPIALPPLTKYKLTDWLCQGQCDSFWIGTLIPLLVDLFASGFAGRPNKAFRAVATRDIQLPLQERV